jgi:hypothetical protein
MKLGVVAEPQRPPDSPDTVLVVEPSIGSTIRTKGNLYLVVTGSGGGELRSATNMVAERIRHEYYYDESAGITVCLQKAVKTANRELRITERLAVSHEGGGGPIGIALAVVRANELYVATIGPAEAYLVRDARLLTLPEPGPASGLPNEDATDPEIWHGDMVAGDSLILISPNATRRIGLGPIQDAVIQLHPQVAIEQIHRQLTGGGIGVSGGDGMLALEASEVPVTQKLQPLKPVWPADSLAGVPAHSPIPLADNVMEGMSAAKHTAKQIQRTADGVVRHGVYGLFDRMPRRSVQRVRVTPIQVQRERQRRLASAVIGLLVVLGVVGSSLWYLGGTRVSNKVDQQQRGQSAYIQAESDVLSVFGAGRDLLTSDPRTAKQLLEDAYRNLKTAKQNGYTDDELASLSSQVMIGLNRLYKVTVLTPELVLSFGNDILTGIVQGPDSAAYVIDHSNDSLYRVDLGSRAKKVVTLKGVAPPNSGGAAVAAPLLLTTGGPDVVMLDDSNQVWRYRPPGPGAIGDGTTVKINVEDSGTWGANVRGIGTFLTDASLGQYNLYVVVPSAGNVFKYPPALDGTGYYAKARSPYILGEAGAGVNNVDDMYIDGSVYLLDGGIVKRYDSGQATVKNWTADPPGDTVVRPAAPYYTRIISDNVVADQGNLYIYDGPGRRVVVIAKSNGAYVGEYVLPASSPYFSAMTGMFIRTGPNGSSPTLFWIEAGNLLRASLTGAGTASPSPGASGSETSSPSASASAKASGKAGPTAKPKATPTHKPTTAPY